jgi:hypothetical protein
MDYALVVKSDDNRIHNSMQKKVPSAGEADFCLLFGGLQKVRRLAGRDPPVLKGFDSQPRTSSLQPSNH